LRRGVSSACRVARGIISAGAQNVHAGICALLLRRPIGAPVPQADLPADIAPASARD